MLRYVRVIFAALLTLALLVSPGTAGARTAPPGVRRAGAHTWVVRPGGSIQAAVDAAHAGDTIVVRAGVYRGSVTITKDGLTLRGAGPRLTVLVPPSSADGVCMKRFGSGMCPVGSTDGSTVDRVANVTISGFGFRGWPGSGVFAFLSKNLTIRGNEARNIGEYGFARFDSVGGSVIGNRVSGADEAGIYVGDSLPAKAIVAGNRVIKSQFGFFIRHTHRLDVLRNVAARNCQGMLVLDDGQPEGAGDILLRNNVVKRNNRLCKGGSESPSVQGGGILLLGATDTVVSSNTLRNNRGEKFNSGGVVLISAKALTGGVDETGNRVVRNVAFGNRSADLRWDGKGTNTFKNNSCGVSQPGGYC